MEMKIWHICVLGFVNSFGYLLPTVYMLKRGKISVFEYLFKSLYLDLIFTIFLSLTLLKRPDLMNYKILIPISIALFGLAFHDTISVSTLSNSDMNFLSFTFVDTLPSAQMNPAPTYSSVYFYLFLIARLSKCFVCVASKLFLLKEQAYRKALRVIKDSEVRKASQNGFVPKAFT
jgi:hypothetical protein